VADKLARRCWSVSRDDLRQEAEVAALHASRNFDPLKGDLRGYLWRSVARHLTNFMWEAGSPVSYKHRRSELREALAVGVDNAVELPSDSSPVAEVGCARWRAAVAGRLTTIAEIEGEHSSFDPELVIPCLLDDVTPLAVSRATSTPLTHVLWAVGRVRAAAASDPIVHNLWRELKETP